MSTGELPKGWTRAKFVDVFEINPRDNLSALSDNTLVSFVPMQAVEELTGRLDPSRARAAAEIRRGYTQFREGDLLFAKITPCMENGKFAIAERLLNGRGFGSTEFHVLRVPNGMSTRYVFYYAIRSVFRNSAAHNMKGTAGQKRVPVQWLKQVEFPVPPTQEQERIVAKIDELFTRLDVAEQNLKNVQAVARRFHRSFLAAAYSGQLTRSIRDDLNIEPAEQLLFRLKQALASNRKSGRSRTTSKDNGSGEIAWRPALRIPRSWKWANLGEISEVVGGITKDAKRKITDAVLVPYLRVANVQRGHLKLESVTSISASPSEVSDLRLRRGDMLLNEGGDLDKLGRGWIWEEQIENCIHQNHVFRARVFVGEVPTTFISRYINEFGQSFFLKKGSQTTNLASVSMSNIRRMPIPLPPLNEMIAIDRQCANLHTQMQMLDEAIADCRKKLIFLRQSILAAAFRGELVPQDARDEPANKLVEQIRAQRIEEAAPLNGKRRVSA